MALVLVSGGLAVMSATTGDRANALPPTCRTDVIWHNGTTYQRDDGTLVESGIHSTVRTVCDAIEPPSTDPSTGDGGSAGTPTGPLAAPGPLLPKPPASVPASAAPPCVEGSNNSSDPERTGDGQTGNGDILVDNLAPAISSGDVTLNMTAPSRVVSMDVNLGPAANGVEGSNPFEGMTPEEAARAMYWPGAFDLEYTEVGPTGRVVAQAVKYAFRAAVGDRSARRMVVMIMKKITPAQRQEVVSAVTAEGKAMLGTHGDAATKTMISIVEDAIELVTGLLESGPIGTDVPPTGVYMEVASESSALGTSATGGSRGFGPNKGVCGQISQATVSSSATLLPGSSRARITLTSTTHGTVVDRIRALWSKKAMCPPTRVVATAGQSTVFNVGTQCRPGLSGMRVLTRQEIADLSSAEQSVLLQGIRSDATAGEVFQFDRNAWEHPVAWPGPASTATLADQRVGFASAGADGLMSYATPTSAGGWVDHVVVAAKDAAGNEHPFLVTVEVKEQPSCSTAEKPVGPDAGAFRAVLRGGEIQAIRNVPLVLQPRLFCSADARDSYRVTVNGSVPGAEITSGADGTLVVTWTDPDVVGTGLGTLEFTAWDEVTGVPSAPVKVPVTARDVAPSCNDVEIDYDWDELGGAPLTIPMDCGMVGGMRVLTPPYLTFLGAGLLSEGEGGEFVSDGTSITFTPHDPDVELSTTQVVPWNADPATASPYRPSGAAFFIDVRMS